MNSETSKESLPTNPARRSFFAKAFSILMAGGLIAGYGKFIAIAARYLFPAKARLKDWLFVTELTRMKVGDAIDYIAPDGTPISIARRQNEGNASDFIALSSTCPHLGCQVHWENQNNRFFCPCHNGAFDPSGKAIAGPPAEANQSLDRYPLKAEKGLLYINVPLEKLGSKRETILPERLTKPGYDSRLIVRQN